MVLILNGNKYVKKWHLMVYIDVDNLGVFDRV